MDRADCGPCFIGPLSEYGTRLINSFAKKEMIDVNLQNNLDLLLFLFDCTSHSIHCYHHSLTFNLLVILFN